MLIVYRICYIQIKMYSMLLSRLSLRDILSSVVSSEWHKKLKLYLWKNSCALSFWFWKNVLTDKKYCISNSHNRCITVPSLSYPFLNINVTFYNEIRCTSSTQSWSLRHPSFIFPSSLSSWSSLSVKRNNRCARRPSLEIRALTGWCIKLMYRTFVNDRNSICVAGHKIYILHSV